MWGLDFSSEACCLLSDEGVPNFIFNSDIEIYYITVTQALKVYLSDQNSISVSVFVIGSQHLHMN